MSSSAKAIKEELSKVVTWLQGCIVADARGDGKSELDNQPSSLFWLGRLAPEAKVEASDRGERGERLEPCAVGMRLRPASSGPWSFETIISVCIWDREPGQTVWSKKGPIELRLPISIASGQTKMRVHEDTIRRCLRDASGRLDISAAIDVSLESREGFDEMIVELVNTSEYDETSKVDSNLYECSLSVSCLTTAPFLLEGLPDAFRYDRSLPGIGLNCSVRDVKGVLATIDVPEFGQKRPIFVPDGVSDESLFFTTLERDPIPSAEALVKAHKHWGDRFWSAESLDDRAQREDWSPEMVEAATRGRAAFVEENDRLDNGARLLKENEDLQRAFRLMNRAMATSADGRYAGWRAFQFGFLLANLASLTDPNRESETVDIVWFATGGGKTETYLGLLIVAMLCDRMRGKLNGITAWSRFPLRMLSLQQTQRFADAIAAAEMVRREEGIEGAPFSLGFFVGQGATPNRIKLEPGEGEPDPYDDTMPAGYLVIDLCPFCRHKSIEMDFHQPTWTLRHRCTRTECPWPEEALPFYIVDEEIYRFLPTVVVGTLDKAASISLQAAMRGFVAPPLGVCSHRGHGFTYAPRRDRPRGCLVPGCGYPLGTLSGDPGKFAPSFRLQDELHLLRDSLGAVDAHYESLYDHLSLVLSRRRPKILGSSATLSGYERQVSTLYARKARAFPQPGPAPGVGFWSSASNEPMRHFVALAPRGVTLEHAVDRTLTVLQRSIRELNLSRESIAAEIGVSVDIIDEAVSLYGTNVVYGNTLRDLDAVARSAETQILVEGDVNQRTLTGRTDFGDIRKTLEELESPPEDFQKRVHVVMASSMMSHGVDIDRLNVMVMIGLPLGTAEFIQATARVGRRHPGLVIVVPKMGRERDAAVYRTYPKFVEHADRLVEPIPITRRSRRVLQRTLPGIELARILMIHEPASGIALTLPRELKKYWQNTGFDPEAECLEIIRVLHLQGALDGPMQHEVREWIDGFVRNVFDPPPGVSFVSKASPRSSPMISLRDVEDAVPIYGLEDDR